VAVASLVVVPATDDADDDEGGVLAEVAALSTVAAAMVDTRPEPWQELESTRLV